MYMTTKLQFDIIKYVLITYIAHLTIFLR